MIVGFEKTSVNWKVKFRTSGIHFIVSVLVGLISSGLVFLVWYPGAYSSIAGISSVFGLILAVDVALGPLLTFIVYNQLKPKKEKIVEFVFIVLIQFCALFYGISIAYQSRPIHLVFEYYRMAVVYASDVDEEELSAAPVDFSKIPKRGPTLISLRPLKPEEFVESTMAAMNGRPQAAQPQLWQPYESALSEILRESHSMSQLKHKFPNQIEKIMQAINRTGYAEEQLRYLPVIGRKEMWTVLIDKSTGRPREFIALDSF